jgi:hypothetical protein
VGFEGEVASAGLNQDRESIAALSFISHRLGRRLPRDRSGHVVFSIGRIVVLSFISHRPGRQLPRGRSRHVVFRRGRIGAFVLATMNEARAPGRKVIEAGIGRDVADPIVCDGAGSASTASWRRADHFPTRPHSSRRSVPLLI